MVGGLFKPGWQSESATKRKAAIEALDADNPEAQKVLESVAVDDSDQAVRHAALHQLRNPALLYQFSLEHPVEESRLDAQHALGTLLGQKGALDITTQRALLSKNPRLASEFAKYSQHAELRTEILSSLDIAEQVELIADVEFVDSRQLIAEQIREEEHLQRARNLLKGKDKNAEKIIRARLDQIHARQKQDQENHEAALQICERVEELAAHELRAETKAQFSIWSQRWDSLEYNAEEELERRYQSAANTLEEKLSEAATGEETTVAQKQLAEQLMKGCYELAKMSKQQLIARSESTAKALKAANRQWKAAEQHVTPEPSTALQYSHAQEAMQSVLKFIDYHKRDKELSSPEIKASIKKLDWPEQYPELQVQTELEAHLKDLAATQEKAKKEAAAKLDKLHKRINRLLGSTKRGDLARAKRELTAITKAAGRFSGKDKSALDERVAQASEAVTKMSDWLDFATEPKYIELCEQMEALVGSKVHADKLSQKINKLQQDWKALPHADSADKHWPRFKEAADKAYEPCSVFFKERRKIRQENLKKREPLVAQLKEVFEKTDWDSEPDYKKIESEMQRINQAWQKIKDVERGPGQKQWNRLSKIRSSIYEKLDVVYDANIEMKNQIIAQTKAMLDTEIKEESLGKLQLFQSRWKQVGPTRRKQDQAAWKNFKKASDAVFDKIQGLRKAKRADEDEKLNGYRNIIKEIQQLAKSAKSLAEGDAAFEQLQADYSELPELPGNLPEKLIKGIAADYRRAETAYAKARERLQQADRNKIVDALAKKAELCASLEAMAETPDDTKVEKVKAAMAEVEINNNALAKQFAKREKVALTADKKAAGEARRLFCIDLEILKGVDSPKEDAALRMKVQLERMKEHGIGNAQTLKADSLTKLKLDWLCLPGADPKTQKALDQRFSKIIGK